MTSSSSNSNDNYEEIKIPVPWGYIAGIWWGPTNVQPILAIHGKQDNAGTFEPIALQLVKNNFSILCIDLPGHGYSSRYKKGMFYFITWDAAHIIQRIVKHFNWTSKLIIMGHSLGAGYAFQYASIFSAEVDKIIAFDSIINENQNFVNVVKNFAVDIEKFLESEELSNEELHYEYEDIRDMIMEARLNALTPKAIDILMKRSIKTSELDDDYYVFSRDPRLRYSEQLLVHLDGMVDMITYVTCKILLFRAENGVTFNEATDTLLEKLKQSSSHLETCTVRGNHYAHLNNVSQVLEPTLKFLKL